MARAKFMAVFSGVRAKFKGGDVNLPAPLAALAFHRRVVGSGVLYLTVPRAGWRVHSHESVDVGSDHDAEFVKMRHKRSGRLVSFLVINCMSVSTGKLHAAQIMRVGLELGATVIMASECRDFTAAKVDRSGMYMWEQPGEPGSSESGALVGVRRAEALLLHPHRVVGSKSTSEGDGIDERSIVTGRVVLNERR